MDHLNQMGVWELEHRLFDVHHLITGTPDSHGTFVRPVSWTMRAADVVNGGVGPYYANVRAWATSILVSLRAAGELG